MNHPGVVHIYYVSPDPERPFLAMELVDGASISRLLRAASARNEPVPLPAILHVGIEAAPSGRRPRKKKHAGTWRP